jgi:hypothetical protein
MRAQRSEKADVEKAMGPLVKGLLVTVTLLLGGLALTQFIAMALEQRAERPIDQAYDPTSP